MIPDETVPEALDHLRPPASPSRRRFLTLGAGAVASAATAAALDRAEAQASTRGKPLPAPTANTAPDASVDWKDPVLRLVRRITMGLEPNEVALARRLGYYGYLEYHLNAAAIDDSAVENATATLHPLLTQSVTALAAADTNEVMSQLRDDALYRATFSKRQLKERMVEFWTDHFNILYTKVGYLQVGDVRQVIRANALGKFPDMVRASATSPAMLLYLDQNTSSTPTPNQNYAREIMELHTLGVDGGYTQDDVAQLSRILTGWSFNRTTAQFTFNTGAHDRTAKTLMGVTYPAMPATATADQQRAEGDAAITQLLNHPSTAKFIATKMARWMLAYTPPQSVIDATAAAYTATGGDIAAMLRTILTAKNLMAAPAKYKRPFHLTASALRGTGAMVANIRAARQNADVMAMPSFNWEQPDGYPDNIPWWSGLVTLRWNFATYLAAQNTATAVQINTTSLYRAPVDTADGVVSQINTRLFGGEMPTSLRLALGTYLKGGTYSDARIRETIALALSSQQFQWY